MTNPPPNSSYNNNSFYYCEYYAIRLFSTKESAIEADYRAQQIVMHEERFFEANGHNNDVSNIRSRFFVAPNCIIYLLYQEPYIAHRGDDLPEVWHVIAGERVGWIVVCNWMYLTNLKNNEQK